MTIDVKDVIALVREFGFPIVVSLWFMWRLEKRLDKVSEIATQLLTITTVMAKALDHDERRP